ncbi:hypothetical protein, partial [Agrobacterium cavarae]|uniref:hypothetical protein n=1 Tax=Agrobacterium cavarae TaxID=2528239 RepID=UPI0028A710E6
PEGRRFKSCPRNQIYDDQQNPGAKKPRGFGVSRAEMLASQSVRREIDRIVSIGPINATLVELCLASALKLVQLL